MSDIAIVVPTIREASILEFLKEWDFRDEAVYVIEDNPNQTFDLPGGVGHFSWKDIEHELGDNQWIISRRCAAIRCYGYLRAARDGAEIIITLDDDCLPLIAPKHFIQAHTDRLNRVFPQWVDTIDAAFHARGMPLEDVGEAPVVLNMGGWAGVPDISAVTQLAYGAPYEHLMRNWWPVPKGVYFPLCGMNYAFWVKYLPLMYWPLMAESHSGIQWPFNRYDDIWFGVILKRACDHLGLAITAGSPNVLHLKASNVWVNLRKEMSGLHVNEKFWRGIDEAEIHGESQEQVYTSLATAVGEIGGEFGDYWTDLRDAMTIWLGEVSM